MYTVQEDFNVNFANRDSKSVQCRTVLCARYHVQERNVPDHRSAIGVEDFNVKGTVYRSTAECSPK